ncbi:PQQ-binding-like beta-propeller repeat protein [Flammeovirga sp. SubArs3]|uniref:outer membrane protein assembly factor BamB family protein n=1 Tax=Flammeovirga sp. SubArs3 TaxID=2995316 RepID=UPI00248D21BB|nr:PQQ-binding-like beta-propeller repeat protein [Flammeovirga sp. SubArs3]
MKNFQLCLLLLLFANYSYSQKDKLFLPSGLSDIDRVRKEVRITKTSSENIEKRRATLYRWWRLLMKQGYELSDFDSLGNNLVIYSNHHQEASKTIDEGFQCLEGIFNNKKRVNEIAIEQVDSLIHTSNTNWPQYHGTNTLQTGFSPDVGPYRGNIAWKFPKSYGCQISPIIENGKIYITGEGSDIIGYCLDEESGKVEWKAMINKANYYSNSDRRQDAIVLENSVQFIAGHKTYKFNKKDGFQLLKKKEHSGGKKQKLICRKIDLKTLVIIDGNGNVLNYFTEKDGITGQAKIVKNQLYYISHKGHLKVVNLDDGSKRSLPFEDNQLYGSPIYDSGVLYISSNSGAIIAYDPYVQKQLWEFKVKHSEERSRQLFSKIEVHNNQLFVGSSNKNIYCLNKNTGNLLWKYKTTDWVRSKPMFHKNMLYIATLDGVLYALKTSKHKAVLKWKRKISDHGFEADLKAMNNGVYAVSKNFILYKINSNGDEEWKHSLLDGIFIGDRLYTSEEKGGQQSSPVVVDNTLYIGGTDGIVNAIDTQTAHAIWKFETVGVMASSPTVAYGKVYFGEAYEGTNTYYAVNAKTGKLIWSTKEYGAAWVNATFDKGYLYLGNMDGYIYCIDAENGKKIWSYNTSKNMPFETLPLDVKPRHGFPPGVYCNPVISEGVIYTGSWSGYYFAINAETGQLKWRTKTSTDHHDGGLPDSAAPVLYKNHLYVQKGGYQLAALNKYNGDIEWVWTAPPGYLQNGTITVAENKIYASIIREVTTLPYDTRIIAFNDFENGGNELWQYRGGGGLTAAALTKEKLIFGSSGDAFVTCLNPEDGSVKWRLLLGGTMLEVVPAIYGSNAFIQCKNGYLYCIE